MSSSEAPPPREFEIELPGGFSPGALAGLGDSAFDDVPVAEGMDVGDPDSDPAIAFRRTLGMFATGVTVLTTRVRDQVHGMTANAFTPVSQDPPMVLCCVAKAARTHAAFVELMQGRGQVEPDEDVLGDGIAFAGVAKFPARVKCALLPWMAFKDAAARAGVGVSPEVKAS